MFSSTNRKIRSRNREAPTRSLANRRHEARTLSHVDSMMATLERASHSRSNRAFLSLPVRTRAEHAASSHPACFTRAARHDFSRATQSGPLFSRRYTRGPRTLSANNPDRFGRTYGGVRSGSTNSDLFNMSENQPDFASLRRRFVSPSLRRSRVGSASALSHRYLARTTSGIRGRDLKSRRLRRHHWRFSVAAVWSLGNHQIEAQGGHRQLRRRDEYALSPRRAASSRKRACCLSRAVAAEWCVISNKKPSSLPRRWPVLDYYPDSGLPTRPPHHGSLPFDAAQLGENSLSPSAHPLPAL